MTLDELVWRKATWRAQESAYVKLGATAYCINRMSSGEMSVCELHGLSWREMYYFGVDDALLGMSIVSELIKDNRTTQLVGFFPRINMNEMGHSIRNNTVTFQ
jgi:hypothetical protein